MKQTKHWLAVVCALMALAAGCSDDGGEDEAAAEAPVETSTPASSTVAPVETSTPATGAVAPVSGADGVECVNLPDCAVEVSDTEGLAPGDVVSVRIEGWPADAATAVSQCELAADPDNEDLAPGPDGLPPADVCNIEGLTSPSQTETSDADGVVAFDYEVRAGQQMTDESVAGRCDAEHDCQLIVFLSFDTRLQSDAPRVAIPLTFA